MKTLNLIQGSPEWHAHRAEHFNASDAPAMMGCSPYVTRSQLLHQLHTGIVPVPTFEQQRRFDEGHRVEALGRTKIAEPMLGEDLYPVVGSAGKLSASFDGLTMAEDTAYEHKSLNDDIRAALDASNALSDDGASRLPLVYRVQMEQQCAVSGCERVLFIASKWNGDTLVEWRGCWYTPDLELRKQILLGWEQFAEDLANYKPPEVAQEVVAAPISALPALAVVVEGRVVTSNLGAFRDAASAFLANIKTDLQTDQDFADAARTVTFCEDGEKSLELVKAQALAQTTSLDELFRTIDDIKEQMRQKRLQLSKLVDSRKTTIRGEIAAEHSKALAEHVAKLNERLGAPWIPAQSPTMFGDAMKGKKNLASVREACGVALAAAKIAASERADRMEANRKSLVREGKDWFFLFADFANAGNVPAETFSAIADQRIRKQEEADAAEKARVDAAAAATAAALAAAQAKPAPAAVTVAAAPEPVLPAPAAVLSAVASGVAMVETARISQSSSTAVLEEAPPINLSEIARRFKGLPLTRVYIEETLKVPHLRREGASYFWRASDLPTIKTNLIALIQAVQ